MPTAWVLVLMRLVRELAPRSCVELGTGLGISTAYQAAALELNGDGRLSTLDVSPERAAIAEQGLSELGLDRAEVRVGRIEEELAEVLGSLSPVEYALVDAEHTEEATLGYFAALIPHLAENAVVVFDDIPWTNELRRTWRAIRRNDRVSLGIGLGRLGIAVTSGPSAGR
jgi:predicted O-methyltransferase YrrM